MIPNRSARAAISESRAGIHEDHDSQRASQAPRDRLPEPRIKGALGGSARRAGCIPAPCGCRLTIKSLHCSLHSTGLPQGRARRWQRRQSSGVLLLGPDKCRGNIWRSHDHRRKKGRSLEGEP